MNLVMSLRVAAPLRGWCQEETGSGTMSLVGSDSYGRVLTGARCPFVESGSAAGGSVIGEAKRGNTSWLSRLGEYIFMNPLRVGAVFERPFWQGVVP
jgi:hypothetical protein